MRSKLKYTSMLLFLAIASSVCAQNTPINFEKELGSGVLFSFSLDVPVVVTPVTYKNTRDYCGYKLSYPGKTDIILAVYQGKEGKIEKNYKKGKIMRGLSSSTKATFSFDKVLDQVPNGGIIRTTNNNHYPFYYFNHAGTTYSFSVYHMPEKVLSYEDARLIMDFFLSVSFDNPNKEISYVQWVKESKIEEVSESNDQTSNGAVATTDYQVTISETSSGTKVFHYSQNLELNISQCSANGELSFPFTLRVPYGAHWMSLFSHELGVSFLFDPSNLLKIKKDSYTSLQQVMDQCAQNRIPGFEFEGFVKIDASGFIAKSKSGTYYPYVFRECMGQRYHFYADPSGIYSYDKALALYSVGAEAKETVSDTAGEEGKRVLNLLTKTKLNQFSFPLNIEVPYNVNYPQEALGNSNSLTLQLSKQEFDALQVYRTVNLDAASFRSAMKQSSYYTFLTSEELTSDGGLIEFDYEGVIPYRVVSDGTYSYLLYYPNAMHAPLDREEAMRYFAILETVQVNSDSRKLTDLAPDTRSVGKQRVGVYNPMYNNDLWYPFTLEFPSRALVSGSAIKWEHFFIEMLKTSYAEGQRSISTFISVEKNTVQSDPMFESFIVQDEQGFIAKYKNGIYTARYAHEFDEDVYLLSEGICVFKYTLEEIKSIYEILKTAEYCEAAPVNK